MASYDIFVLVICLVMFVILVSAFSVMFFYIVKNHLKLIKLGDQDEVIIKDYKKERQDKAKVCSICSYVLNGLISLILISLFAFSLYINARQDSFSDTAPTMRVVLSPSMSKKLDSNDYLDDNRLNDQFQVYDIILTYKVPDEFKLKLYDVVVYEIDGELIVHRIVGIEEPNVSHPNVRYFLCRGDANESADRFPVMYSQIKGIYRGERMPFVGAFVLFLQSIAGWMCLVLVLGTTIFSPFIDKKVEKAKRLRLSILGYIKRENERDISTNKHELETIATVKVIENKTEPDFKTTNFLERDSFTQKIDTVDDKVKDYFNQINNEFLSYKRNRATVSKSGVTYFLGRDLIAKLIIFDKSLKLFLALDNEGASNTKIVQGNKESIGLYEKTPFALNVRNNKDFKRAKQFISLLLDKKGAVKKSKYSPIDSMKLIKEKYDT